MEKIHKKVEGMAKGDTKVEIFLNELLSGKSQRQAYYIAYPHSKTWKEKTVDEKASHYFNSDKVQTRYKELLEAHRNKSIISREELLKKAVKGLNIAIGEEYADQEIVSYVTNEDGCQEEKVIKSKIKGVDLKSLKGLVETIASMEGFIIKKVEYSGSLGVTIVDDVTNE